MPQTYLLNTISHPGVELGYGGNDFQAWAAKEKLAYIATYLNTPAEIIGIDATVNFVAITIPWFYQKRPGHFASVEDSNEMTI